MSIQSNFPTIKPSLLLDFANTETLDPRITFTRATTATYYDGVTTAMAEQNLVTYSQTFSNAAWVASNVTVGAVTTAPDGTSTAYPLTASAGNGTLLQTFTATATAYTFSIYIQRVTGTGNIDITVDGVTYATQTTTGTWTRFNVTTTPAAGSKTVGIRLVTSGDVVNIWGSQLEQRSSVTAYTATTTQPITNYIPVLKTAASGVARFDHNPTTGESLGLLIEEARTNLLTYSEQFDNAAWSKQANITITANTNISPDGTLTADTWTSASATNSNGLYALTTGANSTAYTATIYAKQGSATTFRFGLTTNGETATAYYDFNLSSGTSVSAAVSGFTSTSATMTAVGNGWYRCSVSGTTPASGVTQIGIFSRLFAVANVFIWGAQLEAGAFATSYIPTVASTVTRNADAASMTGANFSSWYNAGEGTMYAEAQVLAITSTSKIISEISDGTASNRSQQGIATSSMSWYVASSGVVSANSLSSGTATANTPFKMASTYKVNDFATVGNAATAATSSSGNIPLGATNLRIGARFSDTFQLNGTIKKLAYYPVRLSNTNLQALTS